MCVRPAQRFAGNPGASINAPFGSEWDGVLAFDEFANATKIMRPPPWMRGLNGSFVHQLWEDNDDILAAQWLQQQGVSATVQTSAQAVQQGYGPG
jgi:hypothetical protein